MKKFSLTSKALAGLGMEKKNLVDIPAGSRLLTPKYTFDEGFNLQDAQNNSIVAACLWWKIRAWSSSPLKLKQMKRDGTEDVITIHALIKLVKRPNKFYSGRKLIAGTLVSLDCDGNAYWYIQRNAFKVPVALWYLPDFMVQPKGKDDFENFVTHYEYTIAGKVYKLPFEDVIHFQSGLPDPTNPRKSVAPLKAARREIMTDNEAALHNAALLANFGIPGIIIQPKEYTDENGVKVLPEFDKTFRGRIKALFGTLFRGAGKGEPMVVDSPMEITVLGFNPQELMIDKLRDLPEERICALEGIPPVEVGLGSGLRTASAKASHEESRRAAYQKGMIPNQEIIADDLTTQLLPQVEPFPDRYEVFYDNSGVEALQESEDTKQARARDNWTSGGISLNEFRKEIGKPPVPGGDTLFYTQGQPFDPNGLDPVGSQDNQDSADQQDSNAA